MAAPIRFDVDGGLRSGAATALPPPIAIAVVPEDGTLLLNGPAAIPLPPPIAIPVVPGDVPLLPDESAARPANAVAPPDALLLRGQALLDHMLNFQNPYAPVPDEEPPVDEDDDEVLSDESEGPEEEERLGPLAALPVIEDEMAIAAAALMAIAAAALMAIAAAALMAIAAAALSQEFASASERQGWSLLDHLGIFQFPYARGLDAEPLVDEDDDEVLSDEPEEFGDESEEPEEEEDRLGPLGLLPVIQGQMANAAAAPGQEVVSTSQLQGRPLLDQLENSPESKRRRTEVQAYCRQILEPGLRASNALAAGPSTTTEESSRVFNIDDPAYEESLQGEPPIEDLFADEMLPENTPQQFVSSFSPSSTSSDGSQSPETGIEPSLDPVNWKAKAAVESPKEASAGPSGSSTEEQPIREVSSAPASATEPAEQIGEA